MEIENQILDRAIEREKRQIKNHGISIIRQINSILRDIENPSYVPNELGELQGMGSQFDAAIARYCVWMELKRERK